MVKPGAVVVDVGTTAAGGRLVGDVHPAVADVAGWLSPVPGGVGPMTITMLLYNTLSAAEQIDGVWYRIVWERPRRFCFDLPWSWLCPPPLRGRSARLCEPGGGEPLLRRRAP